MYDTSAPQPKPGLLAITPYSGGRSSGSGRTESIKLSSNENALGCSQAAIEAYEAAKGKLFRYPDGNANDLGEFVSVHHGLDPERLVFGNGSDEIFALLNQAWLEAGDNIITGEYGFLAYRISALACQANVKLALEPDKRVEIEALLELVDDRTKIIYISNPANPTGTWNTKKELTDLRRRLARHILLVVDEAYAEFVDEPTWSSAFEMATHADNVAVTRTFSKIHGLAGLRVGFGYCPVSVVDALNRIRLPFNVDTPAQAAAVAALQDAGHIGASRQHVSRWRPRLNQEIRSLGLTVHRSAANFVLIFSKMRKRLVTRMISLWRKASSVPVANYGLPEALRVTTGTDDENHTFLHTLKAFVTTRS